MKFAVAISAVSLALIPLGCGDDDASTATSTEPKTAESAPPTADPEEPGLPTISDRNDPRFATVSGEGRRPRPKIDPADRPPPEQLLVRDIRVGTGPVAEPGDEVAVWYLGVGYETGNVIFHTWPPVSPQPLEFELGSGGNGDAFEEGVTGMRVGGRRELIIPPGSAPGGAAIDYIVDLVRVEGGSTTTTAPADPRRSAPDEGADPYFAPITGREHPDGTPEIEPADVPPPKRVLIKELEVGTGPPARPGDVADVYYFGASFETGEEIAATWPPEPPFSSTVPSAGGSDAFTRSLIGMREGGRRALVIPSRLLVNSGYDPMTYLVEMVGLTRDSSAAG